MKNKDKQLLMVSPDEAEPLTILAMPDLMKRGNDGASTLGISLSTIQTSADLLDQGAQLANGSGAAFMKYSMSAMNSGLSFSMPLILATMAADGLIEAGSAIFNDKTENRTFTIVQGLFQSGASSTALLTTLGIGALAGASPFLVPGLFLGIILGLIAKENETLKSIRKKKIELAKEIQSLAHALRQDKNPLNREEIKGLQESTTSDTQTALSHSPCESKDRHLIDDAPKVIGVATPKHDIVQPTEKETKIQEKRQQLIEKNKQLKILKIQEKSSENSRNALLTGGLTSVGLITAATIILLVAGGPYSILLAIAAALLTALAIGLFLLVNQYIKSQKQQADKDIAQLMGKPKPKPSIFSLFFSSNKSKQNDKGVVTDIGEKNIIKASSMNSSPNNS